MFKVFYLISEPKDRAHIPKIPGATKLACFRNFLARFTQSKITICVNNISPELLSSINEYATYMSGVYDIVNIRGGSQSIAFQSVLDLIESSTHGTDNILIQEDDYLYLPDAELKMAEAMEYGHYVTGYLHPDKFMDPVNGGNPFTYAENISELVRVIKTKSHFWMTTNSTTCTFAVKKSVLMHDLDVWKKYSIGRNVTEDFNAFLELRERGRSVLMPIPTLSTHVMPQWLAPLTGTPFTTWESLL